MTEDELVGWHHRLNGHEFEQAPGVGDGQGSLACCRPWGRKEPGTTERLNSDNTQLINGRAGTRAQTCVPSRPVYAALQHEGRWEKWEGRSVLCVHNSG